VFCRPHCGFTNDKQPRAINPDGSLKSLADWTVSETLVRTGFDWRGRGRHARRAGLRVGLRQPGAVARLYAHAEKS
jgi:hypothetical protein